MSKYNSTQITVNKGQRNELTFNVYPEIAGHLACYYRQIDIGDRAVWIKDDVNIFRVAIGGTFDGSIPQDLWDKLYELGGSGAVRGVYCYDESMGKEYQYGKFVHFNDALEMASKKISHAYREALNG